MFDYRVAGDRGVLINFGNVIEEEIFQKVLSYERSLRENNIPGIRETIKGFCTLFISYDPLKIDFQDLTDRLKETEEKLPKNHSSDGEKKILEIPAVYGGENGPDLPAVAQALNISEEEVIRQHLAHDYLIYINGHIGGTAFFKGLGKLFELPRKKTPVLSYPAGSLLFADGMGVALKAMEGPTGWHGIGRSPLRQWYPDRNPPVLIKSGDWIRYRRIDQKEFQEIQKEVEQNTFPIKEVE